MMLPFRLGCPMSLKTPNMGNPGLDEQRTIVAVLDGIDDTLDRSHTERDGLHSLGSSASNALLTGRVRTGRW